MNLWKSFFREDPKKLFLNFSPSDSVWRVVTWNFDLTEQGQRQWRLQVDTSRGRQIIQWDHHHGSELSFFVDRKLVSEKKLPDDHAEWAALMNLSIHSTLKHGLESNHGFMVTAFPGATNIDIQNESRALTWVQASFGTLSRALKKFSQDRTLVLTGAVFSGRVPETGENVLRVIVFNLDVYYYMRPDHSLQIVIFDDKNLGHGKSKIPVFQQIIKVTKPQFYDEIVKLVSEVAKVGELI